jgi:nickel/cobalt transporter (NicO) family protein
LVQWIMSQQMAFHRELVTSVRSLSQSSSPVLLWGLISVSFLYGVFHAAGPGHGKAVISSYMFASGSSVKQGVGLAFISSMAQGLMAVALVLVLSQIFSLAGKAMQMSRFLEIASFAAIGLLGVWMLWRLFRGKPTCCDHHDHESQEHSLPRHSHDHSDSHSHSHSDNHSDNHSDSHAHTAQHAALNVGIQDEKIVDKTRHRTLLALVASIGIRPCTGAVLVLVFSLSAGILHWGILATFAMSLGTAITVSILAATSVAIRESAFTFGRSPLWRERMMKAFGGLAGVFLIMISVSMLMSYLQVAERAF